MLQDQKPAVIEHERQAALLLLVRPTNPLFPQLQATKAKVVDGFMGAKRLVDWRGRRHYRITHS
jgi:hypothetical protein